MAPVLRRRALRRGLALAAVAVVAGWAGAGTASPGASAQEQAPMALPAPTGPAWLSLINSYRAAAGLPAVADEPAWTPSVQAHAAYTVLNAVVAHQQSANLPGFSADGNLAARNSILSYWSDDRDDRTLVEMWMTGPFHLVHVIEPRLQRVAFASARQVRGSRGGSAAVLDIGRGRGPRVTVSDAVLFPGPGASVPVGAFLVENPDPLTHCGWRAPAGLPVVALLPSPPGRDLAGSISTGGQSLELCIVDASYRNPNAATQRTGRAILAEKNAVMLIPRTPLPPDRGYDVTLRSGGRSWAWSFRVGPPGAAVEPARPLTVTPRTR